MVVRVDVEAAGFPVPAKGPRGCPPAAVSTDPGRGLMASLLETFPNQFPDREYEIEITCPEFTAVCPKTGQPDFGTIVITYVPSATCIELKSLKLYLFDYRNRGIFYEHSINTILDDLVAACRPRRMRVVGQFSPRGGMTSRITAQHVAEDGPRGGERPLIV
jgi:7-cyano-7-deazaguanine reductase